MGNAVRFTSNLKFLAAAAAALVIVLGVLILMRLVGSGMPGGGNTAIGFLLLGISISSLTRERWIGITERRWPAWYLVAGPAIVAGAIGLLTLSDALAGRMARISALNLILSAAAALLFVSRYSRASWLAQFLAFLVGLSTLPALMGHLFGEHFLKQSAALVHLDFTAAIGFMALSGALLLVRVDRGLMGVIASEGAGGTMMRRLLPIALLVPLFVTVIATRGERLGYYTPEFSAVLAIVASMVIFAAAVWANAQLLENLQEREAAAREAEEKYRLAFDHAAVGIAHVGLDGRWLDFNGKLLDIVGYTSGELTRLTFKDITHPDDLARDLAHFHMLLSGEESSYVTEKRYLRKTGEIVWIRLSVALVRREDGAPRYFISVVEDITLRMRMDQEKTELLARERAALEASRLKSEFLAMMSHEIRTPINGVLGMAGLLADTRLTSEQREYADGIQRSAEGLLSVLNDVLDLSKIEAGKLDFEEVDFDLLKLFEDAERILRFPAEEKRLSLSLQVDERVPRLLNGDPGRLRQVLMNLVGNAVKFTPAGGVKIRVALVQQSEGQVTIRVEVEDTGIGIPADAQSRLFQAFTQADASMSRRFGGSGLGLSICKHLVSRMGGEIGMKSEEGKGTLFWFTARLSPGKGSHRSLSEPPEFSRCPGLGNATLLVAEDNVVNQKIILRTLQKLGLNAEAVNNGQEVLAALQRSDYAMVLMDCQMPGMDGYDATRAIRAGTTRYGTEIPIVAMTANAYQEDRERCLAAGMNDYLSKPLKTSQLAVALEKWLVKPAREKYCLNACGATCREPFRGEGDTPRHVCAVVIDSGAIDALREVDSGQEGLVIELIERFLVDLPGRLTRMEADLNARDGRVLQQEAHQLKSSGASLGARNFSRLCTEIEELARLRTWPRLVTVFEHLKRESSRVRSALTRELDSARLKAS